MAQVSALVDGVSDIAVERQTGTRKRAKAKSEPIRVRFAAGSDARLHPEKPRDRVWAEVLESLRDTRQPAYVEIDPDTRHITTLLLPRDFAVTALRELPNGEGVDVELEISHARHFLRRGQPGFDEMLNTLERARREKTRVLVTESLDSSTIVDVRAAPPAGARRRQ